MSAVNQSSPAPSLRRLPFLIRLAPEFVNRVSAAFAKLEDSAPEISGLLFGLVEAESTVIQVFRSFSPHPGGSGKHGADPLIQVSFELLLAQSKSDPELAGLKLLGWFSARKADGLRAEDLGFHLRNFSGHNDIALIIRREAAGFLSLELFCRSTDGAFSSEGHRWATVRISSASRVTSPIELPVRVKFQDDFYMQAYRFHDPGEDEQPVAGWKDALTSGTKRALHFLKSARPDDKNESAASPLDLQEIEPEEVDILRSETPSLQAGTSGGAAPAPARIPQGAPDTKKGGEIAREEIAFGPDRPRIVIGPRQAPPATNLGDAVLVRSEKDPMVPPSDVRIAKSVPEPPQPQPFDAKLNPAQDAVAALRSAFSKQLAVRPKKSARDLPWRGMAAVFAVAAVGTFGFIFFKGAQAKGTLPGFLQVLSPTPGLNLKVSTSGDRFQLSWNRDTPAARSARDAILDISDGRDHHQILLGGPEVANGSVLYLPKSDNVVFRLEVHGAGGQNASESLRVVGTAKSASLEVSRPVEIEEAKKSSPARSVAGTGAQVTKNAAGGARPQPALPKPERSQNDLTPAKPVPSQAGTTPPVSLNADLSARGPAVSAPPEAQPDKPRDNAAPSNSASETANRTDAVAENQKPSVPSAREPAESPATNAAASPGTQAHSSEPAKPSEASTEGAPPRTAPSSNASPQIPGPAPTPSRQVVPTSTQSLQTYRPPRPVKQVLPRVNALPPGVVDAVGEVKVLVKVDESGHVTDARLLEGRKKIGVMLGTAALAAAKQWVFEPASLRGQSIASDHTILFQFRH